MEKRGLWAAVMCSSHAEEEGETSGNDQEQTRIFRAVKLAIFL